MTPVGVIVLSAGVGNDVVGKLHITVFTSISTNLLQDGSFSRFA
jgi:Kef-type K+ transport system membrane component KefB